ncbi:hypothetical protein EV360DRAFT_21608, partial [Lentinula raphanica]
ALSAATAAALATIVAPQLDKRPKLTSILTSQKWIQELLCGHPGRFHEQFGMSKLVFLRLLRELMSTGYLHNTRQVTAIERLTIFLYF